MIHQGIQGDCMIRLIRKSHSEALDSRGCVEIGINSWAGSLRTRRVIVGCPTILQDSRNKIDTSPVLMEECCGIRDFLII